MFCDDWWKKRQYKICVVGSGTRFLSGISYYTNQLANALAGSHQVSVILMRQLLPTRFYPGRQRVGKPLTHLSYDPSISIFDGVDWYWLPSIIWALVFIIRTHPNVMIFQWWTGTVLHSYIFLGIVGRLLGAKILIEFHEVQDTGEAHIRFARVYVNLLMPVLKRLASGFVVHSEFDRAIIAHSAQTVNRLVEVISHGPYDQYQAQEGSPVRRDAPVASCNLLFFGVIRPFKGLEDLVRAFDSIPEQEIEGYWLTVVGEPWEDWTVPFDLIADSRYRNRITLVDRYVTDEEVTAFFAGADAVVLPYHRSSASGPLHIAMSWGLPVVVTQVGGLPEAVADYQGVFLVPPKEPASLQRAISQVAALNGKRFENPHSWESRVIDYGDLFAEIINGNFSREGMCK